MASAPPLARAVLGLMGFNKENLIVLVFLNKISQLSA